MSCGKHTYPDKRAAVSAANRAQRRRRNHPSYLRMYWCNRCTGWHLTSKEERET